MQQRQSQQAQEEPPQICGTCLFYEPIARSQGRGGECRRYPPQSAGRNSSFPIVNSVDYCGEYTLETVEIVPAQEPEPEPFRRTVQ